MSHKGGSLAVAGGVSAALVFLALGVGGAGASVELNPGLIAFTAGIGNPDIYAVNANGSGKRRLTRNPGTNEGAPKWSPDGRKIAFMAYVTKISEREIFVMNANGSGRFKLAQSSADPVWSPDSGKIAFVGADGVNVIRADGRGRPLLVGPGGLRPAWSPDSRQIAYAPYAARANRLFVVNADGSGRRALTRPSDQYISQIAWSPDSRTIGYVLYGVPGVTYPRPNIFRIGADGQGQRRLASGEYLAWSPDGRQILFERFLDNFVRVMTSDGNSQKRLARAGRGVASSEGAEPTWSADGTKIAFHGGREGNDQSNIYVMNADGSAVQWVAFGWNPAWRPATD